MSMYTHERSFFIASFVHHIPCNGKMCPTVIDKKVAPENEVAKAGMTKNVVAMAEETIPQGYAEGEIKEQG